MRRTVSVNWWVLPWWVVASAAGFAVVGLIGGVLVALLRQRSEDSSAGEQ